MLRDSFLNLILSKNPMPAAVDDLRDKITQFLSLIRHVVWLLAHQGNKLVGDVAGWWLLAT